MGRDMGRGTPMQPGMGGMQRQGMPGQGQGPQQQGPMPGDPHQRFGNNSAQMAPQQMGMGAPQQMGMGGMQGMAQAPPMGMGQQGMPGMGMPVAGDAGSRDAWHGWDATKEGRALRSSMRLCVRVGSPFTSREREGENVRTDCYRVATKHSYLLKKVHAWGRLASLCLLEICK